jgi:hypothetical protein
MADFKAIIRGLRGYLANQLAAPPLALWKTKPAVFVYPAPPEAKPPYIVIFPIVIASDDTHDTRGEKALYQINLWATRLSIADDIFSSIDNSLHLQTFLIAGYSTIAVQRVRGVSLLPLEPDEELTGLSADYQITVQE